MSHKVRHLEAENIQKNFWKKKSNNYEQNSGSLGNVQRMPDSKQPKKVLPGIVGGKKKRGRAKKQ